MTEAKLPAIHRARYESFGGIISCLDPPFLAWVDQDLMRRLGHSGSDLWNSGASDFQPYLTAPVEVHWAVTNRCSRGCAGCYMDARPDSSGELSTDELKASLTLLRDLGVFHVALGGGEAFERPDFPEIVSFCRSLGLIPNLTTNGLSLGDREIEVCGLLGQVNVSCDGVGQHYGINGRNGSFARMNDAVRRMKKAGVQVGLNCVVSRRNFPRLGELVSYAADAGLNEVEFLKLKPSGRGRHGYEESAMTQPMIRGFYPLILAIPRPGSLELKIDCSFIPALVYHRPPKEDLERLAVNGCEGGNILLSVSSSGVFSGCSCVANGKGESVFDLRDLWHSSDHLNLFRDLTVRASEPCRSCAYLSVCRCGCRATALYHTGDFFAPDPECPVVFDHERREGQ